MIKSNFEAWKPIIGYEGYYEVSTWGRVKSIDRYVIYYNNSKRSYKGNIKKGRLRKDKYINVYLFKNNNRRTILVHRLVAETFIANPNNLPEINHKDEDKSNNRVDNLEWCTRKYNVNYGSRNERCSKNKTNGKKSKKVYQYDLEGNFIKEWPSAAEAGRNSFCSSSISLCCSKKIKTHKKYIWSHKKLN